MARPSCAQTRSIRIRPIRPDDERKLQRLHGRLSDSTIYQRFHGPKPELDEVWACRCAALDGHAAAAFVATTGTRGRIVGVARYYKIGATTTAEVAFVVEDAYQSCGIGTRLMTRLREQALGNGITAFVALLLPRNERMLRLLRAVGPTQSRAASGTVEVQVDISRAEAALAPTATLCPAGTAGPGGHVPQVQQRRSRMVRGTLPGMIPDTILGLEGV